MRYDLTNLSNTSALGAFSDKTSPVPRTTKSSDLLPLLLPERPNVLLKHWLRGATCSTIKSLRNEAFKTFPLTSSIVSTLLNAVAVKNAPEAPPSPSSRGSVPFSKSTYRGGARPVSSSTSTLTLAFNLATNVSDSWRTATAVMIVALLFPNRSATACTCHDPQPAHTASPWKLHSNSKPSMLLQWGSPQPPPNGRGTSHPEPDQ
mmetsp:Transcript_47964/g.145917  ORF Transcript_47964/g.145917 Transcript_47964/m.145917 type:complete len:205 (-) Transcript_47964:221-835(-)